MPLVTGRRISKPEGFCLLSSHISEYPLDFLLLSGFFSLYWPYDRSCDHLQLPKVVSLAIQGGKLFI
jgi:hypothetical protein